MSNRERSGAGAWARRYAPLSGMLIATVLAVLVLPSALNVPQSNPTRTLEFAPVPPADEDEPPPPDTGNVSSLSLGTSQGPAEPTEPTGGAPPPPPPVPDGQGDRPVTKRCVGDPPRQTEDPISPPCVAHFDGDNFGATYQGVTGDTVRVVFVADANSGRRTDNGVEFEGEYKGNCYDLTKPEVIENVESVTVRNLARFQTYFNTRYQTYLRFVNFWVCFSTNETDSTGNLNYGRTPETRRADAEHDYEVVKPFAVMTTQMEGGLEEPYVDSMARKGVLTFGSGRGSRQQEFFDRHPGLIWSYLPTIEKQAELFVDYACSKVVGKPVVDSGNEELNGQDRRLGLLFTTDDSYPELQYSASLIERGIEDCGGTFVDKRSFPSANFRGTTTKDPQAAYADQNMASFQLNGVTTIIWAGGFEPHHSDAASEQGYYPEIVIAGDGVMEASGRGRDQAQDVWDHAWVETQVTYVSGDDRAVNYCVEALRSVDPEIGEDDLRWGCFDMPWYEDITQLFTGVQVAGPKLTPETVDRGFHAIPEVQSPDPRTPACFYDPGDYTCVKDATVMYWDPSGQDPRQQVGVMGCYRMVEDGERYFVGIWPPGNIDAQRRAAQDEICNSYDATVGETAT